MLNNLALLSVYGAAALVKRLFFGEFRPVELQQMRDVLATSVVDLLLAMTIFRDDFNSRFLGLAVGLLFLQWFHAGLRLRVDYVEQTTQMSRFDLWRLAILAGVLLLADVLLVWYALVGVLENGVGAVVLFGFEATLMACAVIQTSLRLVYNVYDMQVNYHWRAKGFFVLWTDFVAECFNVLVYIIFFSVVLIYVGRPLHLIRQMYYTFRRFLDFVHDISLWRRATANFDERYADVTQAELLEQGSDDVCMICREQVDVGKRLPCGHVLHAECLQDWLRRKQICPTCRVSVLKEEIRDPNKLWRPPRERAAARAAAAAAAAAAGDAAGAPQAGGAPAVAPARGAFVPQAPPPGAADAPGAAGAVERDDDDDDEDDAPAEVRAAPRADEPQAQARVRSPRSSRRKKDKKYKRAVALLLEAASDAALGNAESRRQALIRAQQAVRLLDDAEQTAKVAVSKEQWREVNAVFEHSKARVDELATAVRRMQTELVSEHARLARIITGQSDDAAAAESSSAAPSAAPADEDGEDESALLAKALSASLEDRPAPKRATEAASSSSSSSVAPATPLPKFSLPASLTTPPATPTPTPTASVQSKSPLAMSMPSESLASSLDGMDTSAPLSASVGGMTTPNEREELRQRRLARLGSLQLSAGGSNKSSSNSNTDEHQS